MASFVDRSKYDERDREFDQMVGSRPGLESFLVELERGSPTLSTVLILREIDTVSN